MTKGRVNQGQLKGRVEDVRLTTGAGQYVDDVKFENQTYLGIVRSPYPHAKITKIDFSKARESPDFVASLTGEELLKLGVSHLVQFPMQKPANRYPLAVGKTVYVGEAVAAVLARKKYAVEDLIDEVEVEYEELPAVVTIDDAKKNSTLIFESWKDNVAIRVEAKHGDVDSALKSAAFVVRERMGIERQAGVPIEPRAVAAKYDRAIGVFEVHTTVQSANRAQNYLTQEMSLPKEKFHVIVMDVGGGFGTKGAQSYPEPTLACIFARATGLPVKWTSTRTEDFLETAPGRDHYCDIELAADANGILLALRANLEMDIGVSGTLSVMSGLTLRLIPGAYRIPNLDLKSTAFVTNKPASGPVRGAGRPEACYFIERAIDILSQKMQIDPIELRRRNMILPREFPYDNGAGFTYDSANFPLLLDTMERAGKYTEELAWRDEFNRHSRKDNTRLVAGVGICTEIEDTGSQFSETARLVLNISGDIVLYTGSSPHGQGLETTLAQLVSEELNVSMEKVRVVYGDTDLIPFGIGTFGSRSIAAGGSAAVEVARRLKAEILHNLKERGIDASDFSFSDHSILTPSGEAFQIDEMLGKLGIKELSASTEFKMSQSTFASGAHLCSIILDLDTGKIQIKKYVAVDDVGRIVNEQIVDGQIQGGVIHGVGGSIYESLAYDSECRPLATTFIDYLIPSAVEAPDIEVVHVETPSNITLDGARGAGECGTVAAYPTVINAINDALREAGVASMNIAPASPERVRALIARDEVKITPFG